MENLIIVVIILLAAGGGIFYTVRHFKGQGGCCCGGGYKTKKKKLKRVIYKKKFEVEGMHCGHCKNRVEEVVNDIKGVAGSVNLKTGELIVSYAEEVDDELIKTRIEKAGYNVTKIGGRI